MKKNVIALMLSFVMTAGSIGTAPVLAAENGATEVETAAEAAESEEILEEHQPEEYPAVPIELEEETAENYAQDELEEASGEETDGEYNDLTDQVADNETDFPDQETAQQDVNAEGVSEGPAEKETLPPDSAVPEELRTEQTIENKMTPDQIQAFQDCVKIWKTDNRVTIVYDSTEDVQLEYSLYSGITDELLYTGDLEWNEESGLYYGSVDFDAVNEASGQTSGKSKTNIKGIPVRILLENNADQDDGGVERFEEIVSQDSGIVTIDTDTKTEGQIIVKWNSIDNDETDGYSVIVRGENGKAPLLIYDTACSADDTNDKYELLDVDHTDNDQISLNTDLTNVSEISVAAYQYVADTGVKCYGEAVAYERIEEEAEPESSENEIQNSDEGGFRKEGVCGDNVKWVLTGTNPDTDPDLTLTISGTGDMYDDISFSDWTLYNRVIGKVVIEKGVTGIGTGSFADFNNLQTISIPNTVTRIGQQAFYCCYSLESIAIPEGVTSIGGDTFYYCSSLESVTIPNSVTSVAGGAFYHCSSLTSVTIPDGVTSIGVSTFYQCSSLTSVTIPDSVTSIGDKAFYECDNLTSITIPDKVTSIGKWAFHYCKRLSKVTIPDGITIIKEGTFNGCSSLANVTIPDNVATIGDRAFMGCESFTDVTIPEGVTSIGAQSFENCFNLTYINIPKSVTVIGYKAFSHCYKLTDVTIPDDVTHIGQEAFYLCSSLSSVTIPDGVTSIQYKTFSNCSRLTRVTIPDSVTYVEDEAFYECENLTDVTIPDSVERIGKRAFMFCSSLTSVSIMDGVMSIGEQAFYDCKSLTNVTIPDSVMSIGKQTFYGCESLTNVTIPKNVTKIEKETFGYCISLTEISIPDSVTAIGEKAFFGCEKLTKAVILYNVIEIEKYAFYQGNYYGGPTCVPIEKLTIYGYYGSYAEQYANKNGIPFVDLNGMSWDNQGTYSPYKTIALQAASTGHYITCDIGAKDGNGKYPYMNDPDLNADATWIRSYEKFELVPCSDGSYALRSAVNRQFIKYYRIETDNGTYDYISCDADFVDEDVKLTLTKGERGKIKFKNRNVWLCIKDDKLAFTDDENEASVFNQILIDDNRYTSKTLEKLSCDEWFELGNLNNYGLGGLYDIQWDVGHKSTYNANTLRNLGYKIMNVEDQLGKRDYIEIYNMQCFIAYKETNGSYDVIIAFQGTDGYDDKVADGQSNIHGGGEAGSDGMHQGYSAMAKKLIDNEGSVYGPSKSVNLKRLIESEDAKNGKIQFTILGHSMGGAIAQCYALHLNEEGVPKDKIKGRTFNSALAVIKDYEDFTDWINLCVSSDSVCNGLVTGSILSYGVHRLGETIWLYDNEPDQNNPDSVSNISSNKHVMDEYACLYKILKSYRKPDICNHDWDSGVTLAVATKEKDGLRSFTCKKCGRNKTEVIPSLDSFKVSGLVAKHYTGKPITQNPVLSCNGITLRENTDYVVSYKNNVNVGTAYIIIKGIGDYSGSRSIQFIILPGKTIRGDMYNLANNVKVEWKEVPGAKYYKVYREGITDPNESQSEPVIVTSGLVGWDKQSGLTNGHAYKYRIVASLTGETDSTGDSELSYSKNMYRLKTVVIRSAKNTAPGKVTIKYDKTTSGDSYVIQYADNKDMKNAKAKVIKDVNKTSCEIGGFKKGKIYYFSIRVRKVVNGIAYYTTFGVPKKVTITK